MVKTFEVTLFLSRDFILDLTKGCVIFAFQYTKTKQRVNQITFQSDVAAAVKCMRDGGVILYPTDTVWGIGCDATRSDAVRRVFEIKRRVEAKALITLVGSIGQLCQFVDDPPEVALELAELATTPCTIVYDHPRGLAQELLAPDGSAGVRLTSEDYSRAICMGLRRPVVSTSANVSGEPTPKFFAEISKEIIDAVDYVAFYRRNDLTAHAASSVIKIASDSSMKIIRR